MGTRGKRGEGRTRLVILPIMDQIINVKVRKGEDRHQGKGSVQKGKNRSPHLRTKRGKNFGR